MEILTIDHAKSINKYLKSQDSDALRVELLDIFTRDICQSCGSVQEEGDYCYCWNDD